MLALVLVGFVIAATLTTARVSAVSVVLEALAIELETSSVRAVAPGCSRLVVLAFHNRFLFMIN